MATLYDFTVGSPRGPVDLWDRHGRVVLVVHTGREDRLTSKTPQLEGVNRLAGIFADACLVVLAIPDPPLPGSPAPTTGGLGVSFDLLASTDDPGVRSLLSWLSEQAPGPFGTTATPGYTKFLVGRDGGVIRRFAATDDPAELIAAIRTALAAPVPPAPPKPVVPVPAGPPSEPVEPAAESAPARSAEPAPAESEPPEPVTAESEPAPPESAPAAPEREPAPVESAATAPPESAQLAESAGAESPLREEDDLQDIAQQIYEVGAEVDMVEQVGREQREARIEAELAAALGEQAAVDGADQPGTHVTSDPSTPDGESTPTAPEPPFGRRD